jgi:hypothetical protein
MSSSFFSKLGGGFLTQQEQQELDTEFYHEVGSELLKYSRPQFPLNRAIYLGPFVPILYTARMCFRGLYLFSEPCLFCSSLVVIVGVLLESCCELLDYPEILYII